MLIIPPAKNLRPPPFETSAIGQRRPSSHSGAHTPMLSIHNKELATNVDAQCGPGIVTLVEKLLILMMIEAVVFLLICLAASAATRDPVFSITTSSLAAPRQLAVSIPYNGVTRITTDGSTPNGSSPLYTKPILISHTQTVKAISIVSAVSSNVISHTFTLDAEKFPAPSAGGTTAPAINLQLPTTGQ